MIMKLFKNIKSFFAHLSHLHHYGVNPERRYWINKNGDRYTPISADFEFEMPNAATNKNYPVAAGDCFKNEPKFRYSDDNGNLIGDWKPIIEIKTEMLSVDEIKEMIDEKTMTKKDFDLQYAAAMDGNRPFYYKNPEWVDWVEKGKDKISDPNNGLLPCSICGSKPVFKHIIPDSVLIRCPVCDSLSTEAVADKFCPDPIQNAIERWNKICQRNC